MKSTNKFRFLYVCVVLLATYTLLGCVPGKKVIEPIPTNRQGGYTEPSKTSPVQEVEAAFATTDYARVEILGQRLLQEKSLSSAERARVAQLYAVAALRANHPNVALTALDIWRQELPSADSTREWQEVWCDAIMLLPSRDARIKANDVYQDSSRQAVVRGVAAIAFAVRQWEDSDLGETLTALEYIYGKAPDQSTRAMYEGRLATSLQAASGNAIGLIADSVTETNKNNFPYNIILIDQLHRQTADAQLRLQAQAALAELGNTVVLADKSLLQGPPAPIQFMAQTSATYTAETAPISSQGGGKTIALILPRSGQYGVVSAKIIAGAELGARERGISLAVIDTDQPGWLDQVKALPIDSTVVGGPLRTSDYTALKGKGLLSERVFLAFLPTLEQGAEGTLAWRFFSSPADQVRVLTEFTGSIGVKRYASLYPKEPYGERMTALFEKQATSSGATVKSSSYTPNQSDSWMSSAGGLLASANFQAVFLPDTYKNVDMLIPSIEYYQTDGNKMILLGTSLWEQGLSGAPSQSLAKFSTALFPGTWNSANPAARSLMSGISSGSVDFWTGLGYDFIRLSSGLGIQPNWTTAAVNSALGQAKIDWSTAPIFWDSSGRASQEMYVFTPREGQGYVPADREVYRRLLEQY